MNPLTNTRNITNLSKRELSSNGKTSWHDEYKDSAWVFTGGLPYDLSEGDVIAIFSQFGEIVNINLCRDKVTGKQKGFAFICYEDQRSTILAVDNFNGIKILGRTIRVDHVKDYKPPKDSDKLDDVTRQIMAQGCAPAQALNEDFLLPLPPTEKQPQPENVNRPTNLLQIKMEPSSERKEVAKPSKSSKQDKVKEKSKKSKKSSSKSKKKKSKHKKEKTSKHKKGRHESSSSSEDSDSESESESESESSEEEEKRQKKRRR